MNKVLDDVSEDQDNDYVSNLEEYRAGTDPNYAETVPLDIILAPVIIPGSILVLVTISIFAYRRR